MSAHLIIFVVSIHKTKIIVGKSAHFFGQPVYGQLIKSPDRTKITEMSRKNGGVKYVKSFDGYTHLFTMLFAVIMRFDSLREIEAAYDVSMAMYRGLEQAHFHIPDCMGTVFLSHQTYFFLGFYHRTILFLAPLFPYPSNC